MHLNIRLNPTDTLARHLNTKWKRLLLLLLQLFPIKIRKGPGTSSMVRLSDNTYRGRERGRRRSSARETTIKAIRARSAVAGIRDCQVTAFHFRRDSCGCCCCCCCSRCSLGTERIILIPPRDSAPDLTSFYIYIIRFPSPIVSSYSSSVFSDLLVCCITFLDFFIIPGKTCGLIPSRLLLSYIVSYILYIY